MPYFGTDGENASGVSGKDMSISTTQQLESQVTLDASSIITSSDVFRI